MFLKYFGVIKARHDHTQPSSRPCQPRAGDWRPRGRLCCRDHCSRPIVVLCAHYFHCDVLNLITHYMFFVLKYFGVIWCNSHDHVSPRLDHASPEGECPATGGWRSRGASPPWPSFTAYCRVIYSLFSIWCINFNYPLYVFCFKNILV